MDVRSVQRMVLPQGRDAERVRDQYFSWVSGAMWPVIEVKTHGSSHAFGLRRLGLRLLEMTLNVDRSNRDRQLFNIRSGMLVAADNQGRLEFRVVLGRRFVLVAIHDFRPALPWFIYKYTQAAVHLMVMRAFASELTNKNHRFKTARK